MEEEKLFGEQPEDVETCLQENSEGSPSEELDEETGTISEAEKGVTLGKFKNVNDLYDAYNSLQKEFTRKSQKLAELEKETAMPSLEEKKDSALKSFLSNNSQAVSYTQELISRVGDQCDEASFKHAWADILYEKLTCSDKAQEPIIQNLISDDEIQTMVIKSYVKQLQEQKIPIVMSSGSGERVTKTVAPKPDNLEAAKQAALDLFSR